MRRSIRVIAALGVVGWGCSAEFEDARSGSGAFAPTDVPVMPGATDMLGTAGTGALPMDASSIQEPLPPIDTTVGVPMTETPMSPTSPTTEPPPVVEPSPVVDPPTTDPTTTDPTATPVGVPDTEYCADVAGWDPLWIQFEEEVLLLVNENRAAGATCGGEAFPPVSPLTMQENLRCSARLHSMDMGISDYFDHTSLDGRTPGDRMSAAGYAGAWSGENIAWGQRSPEEVMNGWMNSAGHCRNIMNGNYTEIGIGYYRDEADPSLPVWQQGASLWTQNFGRPGRW